MPTVIQQRSSYRSPWGVPNVLTPPDDTLPGFDPNAMQSQNVSMNGTDIPTQAPIPVTADNVGDLDRTMATVALNHLDPGTGIRRFRAPLKPTMPPPEIEAPPQSKTIAPGSQINTGTPPEAPKPETLPTVTAKNVGDIDNTVATGAKDAPKQYFPPEPQSTSDKIQALNENAPAVPQDNWAQRLGRAVLSLTRFRDSANMLIHPKYAAERAAFQTQRGDLEEQQKEEIAKESADALEAQREGQAAFKHAQAEQQGLLADTRKAGQEERTYKDFVQSMGPGAVQVSAGDQVPPGFHTVQDPRDPNTLWVRRSAFVPLTKSMLPFFPDKKEGDQVTNVEYDAALKANWAQMLEDKKAGNKPDKPKLNLQQAMAARSLGLDPDDPDKWGPGDARKVEDELARQAQQIHVHAGGAGGGDTPPMTPGSPEDAKLRKEAANDPSLDYDAWTYMLERKFNVRGIGKGATIGAQKIKQRAGQIMNDLDLDPGELFARAGELKGNIGAYAKISNYDTMIGAFEGTLQRNAKVAQELSDQYARGDLRLYNRVLSAWKTGTGDPEALNLAAQLHGLSREWGKIMAGSTSAMGVPISEANATDQFFGKGIANGQLSSLINNVIIPDARNRSQANQAEKDRLLGHIRGLTGKPTGGGGTSNPGGSAKTATAAHVADYARQKKITVEQATKEFTDSGYTIQK